MDVGERAGVGEPGKPGCLLMLRVISSRRFDHPTVRFDSLQEVCFLLGRSAALFAGYNRTLQERPEQLKIDEEKMSNLGPDTDINVAERDMSTHVSIEPSAQA